MPDAWFRLPTAETSGKNAVIRPAYLARDGITGWSGTKAPGESPAWFVRVFGTTAALDAVAAEPNATRYDAVPADALAAIVGHSRDVNGWRDGFVIATVDN